MGLQAALVFFGVLALTSVTVEGFIGFSLPLGNPFKYSSIKWDHLKVKFELKSPGRYTIPLSTGEMGKDYKYLQDHEEFPQVKLYTFKDDPRVQIMYDAHGKVCGMRVAYVIANLRDRIARVSKDAKFPYTFDDKPIYKKGSAMGKEFYYIDVLFIHPDVLKSGGPETRDEAVGTGVYVNMDGKTWEAMPRKEEEIVKTKFTKQACFLGMGQHYFYDMTENMRCEDHQPVFLLYHKGQLIGLGLIPFGTFDSKFGRPWFENPPKSIISTIVPHAPQCLAEWVGTYGTVSLHIYFRQFNRLNCFL